MSAKPTILVTRQFPGAVMARLRQSYSLIDNPDDHAFTQDELISKAANAEAILCDPTNLFSPDIIDHLPDSIGLITTFSVGYDHIDAKAALDKGIKLGNTPDVLTDATADITLLCMLGASRLAYKAAQDLRAGKWGRWSSTDFLGFHMSGKKLAIVGMGRIGQAVARRAIGFDMQIHYHNRRPVMADGLAEAVYHTDLQSLLPNAQYLSLNCPLTPETHHLVNRETLKLLPKNAVIVNTARGAVIDDAALIPALQTGQVGAAGLDVFENEPAFDKRYLELENVFLLPHIGSATHETRDAMGFKCCDNLDAFFADEDIPNPITL